MSDPEAPVTTVPPFNDLNQLPACAIGCGPLHDANGGCVPPAVPSTEARAYTACFCAYDGLRGFMTASEGICNGACANEPDGLSSIAAWYQDTCGEPDIDGDGNGENSNKNNNNGDGNDGGNGGTGGNNENGNGGDNGNGLPPRPTPGSGSSNSNDSGGGGDWLSNHWQWVIMLVILVVGIAGIWIGACIWRRRYLKKRDRQTSESQKQSGSARYPSWGPGMSSSRPAINPSPPSDDPRTKGSFMPGTTAAAVDDTTREKKRWTVNQRT